MFNSCSILWRKRISDVDKCKAFPFLRPQLRQNYIHHQLPTDHAAIAKLIRWTRGTWTNTTLSRSCFVYRRRAYVGRNHPFGVNRCSLLDQLVPLLVVVGRDKNERMRAKVWENNVYGTSCKYLRASRESTSSAEVGRCSWQKVASRDSLERATGRCFRQTMRNKISRFCRRIGEKAVEISSFLFSFHHKFEWPAIWKRFWKTLRFSLFSLMYPYFK